MTLTTDELKNLNGHLNKHGLIANGYEQYGDRYYGIRNEKSSPIVFETDFLIPSNELLAIVTAALPQKSIYLSEHRFFFN